MGINICELGLFTDYYELSMAQGYFAHGKKEESASFDYFFRSNPFQGGFTVFAGLQDLLELLTHFVFSDSDIHFLKKQGFDPLFLEYLKDFRFTGNIYSVNEGEIVFPNEPLVRVEGNIIECQLVESLLLNILNFESLIATKAFRIRLAANGKVFSDFGLRRAQGIGAIQASRAAYIGGAAYTSNVMAGKKYSIPVSGTQAHSWIQSFDNELEAFRAYVKTHPENTTLLVDTYNTLQSGIPNVIKVAGELAKTGKRIKAVRLDSGDLAYLSKKTRKMLDDAGLKDIQIIASNQLNEYVIKSLLHDQKAPIDAFGVGTELITGKNDAALDGVYKLAEVNGRPKMKLSENIEKNTLPGKKELVRYLDQTGKFCIDGIFHYKEDFLSAKTLYHPIYPEKNTLLKNLNGESLLFSVMKNGEITFPLKSLDEIREYLVKRSKLLPDEHKRFISPHLYKVGISDHLAKTRKMLTKEIKNYT